MGSRVLVLHPPLTVARDFIDYPYACDLGAVQLAAVLREAHRGRARSMRLPLPGARECSRWTHRRRAGARTSAGLGAGHPRRGRRRLGPRGRRVHAVSSTAASGRRARAGARGPEGGATTGADRARGSVPVRTALRAGATAGCARGLSGDRRVGAVRGRAQHPGLGRRVLRPRCATRRDDRRSATRPRNLAAARVGLRRPGCPRCVRALGGRRDAGTTLGVSHRRPDATAGDLAGVSVSVRPLQLQSRRRAGAAQDPASTPRRSGARGPRAPAGSRGRPRLRARRAGQRQRGALRCPARRNRGPRPALRGPQRDAGGLPAARAPRAHVGARDHGERLGRERRASGAPRRGRQAARPRGDRSRRRAGAPGRRAADDPLDDRSARRDRGRDQRDPRARAVAVGPVSSLARGAVRDAAAGHRTRSRRHRAKARRDRLGPTVSDRADGHPADRRRGDAAGVPAHLRRPARRVAGPGQAHRQRHLRLQQPLHVLRGRDAHPGRRPSPHGSAST